MKSLQFPNKPRHSNIEFRPNFHKADYDAIKLQLGKIDWNYLFQRCVDVNDKVKIFYENLSRIIKKCIPLFHKHKFNKYPIWFSPALINLLKLNYTNVKFIKYKNRFDKIEFEYLREDCDGLMRECYRNYIQSLEKLIFSNPKVFWTHIKNKRRNSSNYPPFMFLNDTTGYEGGEICNLFATHFSSMYEVDTGDDVGLRNVGNGRYSGFSY